MFGVPVLVLGGRTSSAFVLGLVSVLAASVPAWSMIAGAVGAPVGRKLRHMLGLLAFVLVFDVVAYASGWQQMASTATVVSGLKAEVLITTYQLVLVSAPVVTLVIFAGKRPSVFWTRE